MFTTNSVLTVANCAFIDNKVGVTTRYLNVYGGGMYNYNSAPTVTNCTFTANQAGNRFNTAYGTGGGMCNEGYFGSESNPRWPVITGCTFNNNVASSTDNTTYGGGGMANLRCSPTVDRCTFTGNMAGCGGGMLNSMAERPMVTNCTFAANTTIHPNGRGGAIYNLARAHIINGTFYKNGWRPSANSPYDLEPYTMNGGAIYDERLGSQITNCLFSDNAVRIEGGAILSAVTSLSPERKTTLTNCLFYENIAWQVGHGDPELNHVYGTMSPYSVDNLYDIDPLLVDPAGGDFHLRDDSPCIDAGTTLKFTRWYGLWLWMPATDFEGDKRIVDSDGDGEPAADIGVDEVIPDLPALRAILMALIASSELDEATAARLLAYVDDAQAALDQGAKDTAIQILNALIADVRASLGGTETAQRIIRMAEAIIEQLD